MLTLILVAAMTVYLIVPPISGFATLETPSGLLFSIWYILGFMTLSFFLLHEIINIGLHAAKANAAEARVVPVNEAGIPFDRHFSYATGGKIGMWIFLVTDAMTFAGFLIAYANLRSNLPWPNPSEYFGIGLTATATFILICSSVSMVLALAAGREDNRRGLVTWLVVTIFGGLCFLSIQAWEWTHLIRDGMTFTSFAHGAPQFGSTFYLITGFHGLHVLSGVIYLLVILLRAGKGRYEGGDVHHVELAGLFWHFVDLIWILVFTFIYLL
jgi:heme/copper-type cytochrome/quinol oxidase subunit 3